MFYIFPNLFWFNSWQLDYHAFCCIPSVVMFIRDEHTSSSLENLFILIRVKKKKILELLWKVFTSLALWNQELLKINGREEEL